MRKFLVILLCLVGAAQPAWAHAMLEKAVPAVGSTVKAAPKELTLTFSEGVEPAFTTVEVTDAGGKRVDSGKPQAAPNDRRVLTVALQPLGPGQYTVVWHALSVDTHRTEGRFTFSVAP